MEKYNFSYFLQKSAEISINIDNNDDNSDKLISFIKNLNKSYYIDHCISLHEYKTCKLIAMCLEDNRYDKELTHRGKHD